MLGILLSRKSFAEYGITSKNFLWSLKWGFYLSLSVCIPAFIYMAVLGFLGLAPLRLEKLTLERVIRLFFVMVIVVTVPEELFFRDYVQTRLNEVFGKPYTRIPGFKGSVRYGLSALITGIIFGLVHTFNYVNPPHR